MINLVYNIWKFEVGLEVPEEWNDLSIKALSIIYKQRSKWRGLSEDLQRANELGLYLEADLIKEKFEYDLIELLYSNCSRGFLRRLVFRKLSPEWVNYSIKTIRFVIKENQRTKIPLQVISFRNKKFYGPDDSLGAITGEEFHFSEKLYLETINGKEDSKYQLAAVLFRPKGKGPEFEPGNKLFKGDQREPFNRYIVEERANQLEKYVKPDVINSIVMWFEGVRLMIIQNNKKLFESKGESSVYEGWVKIFRSLAPTPIEFENIGKKPLAIILKELSEQHEELRRAKLKNKVR